MTYIKWDDSFSVNVREFDLQHQKLIGMINEFYEHIGNGNKDYNEVFRTLLVSLFEYTQYHFSTEEKYFEKYRYPSAVYHTDMHKKFAEKVIDVRNRLDQGEIVVYLEITTFLKDWLTYHIKKEDKAYSKHLNDHGLT